MSNARFSVPKATPTPEGTFPQFANNGNDLNTPMLPIPDTFPYLRDLQDKKIIYPWNEMMAARSDLVEGYDPDSEKEQTKAIDDIMSRGRDAYQQQLEGVNSVGQNAYGHNPFATRG